MISGFDSGRMNRMGLPTNDKGSPAGNGSWFKVTVSRIKISR